MSVRRPSPRPARFGARRPPTARAVLPSVSVPRSPYASASGAAPTPKESHTRRRTFTAVARPHSPGPPPVARPRVGGEVHIPEPVLGDQCVDLRGGQAGVAEE